MHFDSAISNFAPVYVQFEITLAAKVLFALRDSTFKSVQ
jgi:hypothetical protein